MGQPRELCYYINLMVKAKTRRRNPWIITVIVILTLVLVGGLSWLYANNSSGNPEATPSPSATPVKTEAQTIAENSVFIYMSAVMENVVAQTSADANQQVKVETETATIAADGTPAAVATVNLSDLPAGVSIEQNIAYIKEVIAQVNSIQGTSWTVLEATDEFADQPEIVGALKLWEEAENPINPAIIDVIYFNRDGKISVTITATVYLGNNSTTENE